jgi:hypothetical protein
MSQNAPESSSPPLFNPASVAAREYSTAATVALILWCIIGVVIMFAGNAILDTTGLVISAAEAVLLLVIDRRGFYTAAGLIPVDRWSSTQRVLLAIAEVPFFFIVLVIYAIRIGMRAFSRLPDSSAERQ